MEHSARKLATVASIIIALTMAFVPVADASTGAELESPVTEDGDAPEYELLLATALFFVGLFAAGAITGYVAGELLDSSVSDEDNAGNQEAVDQAFRKTESEKMTFAADTAKNIIATVLPADAELWFFTGDYWQKTIEYVVCDTWFKDNNGYSDYMNDIMVGTGLQTNAANYLYTWGAAIDNSYNNIFDYYADQISPNNYASGISVSLDYGSGCTTRRTTATRCTSSATRVPPSGTSDPPPTASPPDRRSPSTRVSTTSPDAGCPLASTPSRTAMPTPEGSYPCPPPTVPACTAGWSSTTRGT